MYGWKLLLLVNLAYANFQVTFLEAKHPFNLPYYFKNRYSDLIKIAGAQ